MILYFCVDVSLNEDYESFMLSFFLYFYMNKRRKVVRVNKTSTQQHKLHLEFDQSSSTVDVILPNMWNSKSTRF